MEEVVITKSSVLNEPGHTKVIEETKKTTYITSTSIINEEIHFVEDSGKPVAIDENVSTVKKTVVEVKGAEVAVEHKAVSRSSSSSSSSSEDDVGNKQDAKENEVVIKNESEKEEMPDESKDNIEVVVNNLSCEKDEEIDQQISPEIESAPTIIIEEPLETKEELAKEETAEEIEAKRKASLIQAEVKVVSESANLQEDEENNSSSSSSSSSDNEEDESTTKNQAQVEEMVVPSVNLADEDSLVLECPSNSEAEEPKIIDEKQNEPGILCQVYVGLIQ